MQIHLSDFDFLPHLRVVRVDFDASTFEPNDLLWLPHHNKLSNAVVKRRAEHLAGRIAAHEALRFHGVNNYIPDVGLHRAPCWPPGFTGSITHTNKLALATVMPASPGERCGIGIDTEIIMNTYDAQEVAGGVINAAERELLSVCGLPFSVALTLVFSAKESLFKALYPHIGDYFDFFAAKVTEINAQNLELKLTTRLGPFKAEQSFYVCWNSEGERLTTLILI